MDSRGEAVRATCHSRLILQMAFSNRRHFNKPGSAFDFAKNDIGQMKDKARELEDQQKGMKKKINPKVLNMIDR